MTAMRSKGFGLLAAALLLLSGCSGGFLADDEDDTGGPPPVGQNPDPTPEPVPPPPAEPPPAMLVVTGSVGDGPVIEADLVVTDADGRVVATARSSETADYRLELRADTRFPVRLTATGGTDLVTDRALDFPLVGSILSASNLTVNVAPLTSLAVSAAQCSNAGLTEAGLANAWARIYGRLSFGLDERVVADPMRAPVTGSNVATLVLANEALGETVRRTMVALEQAGRPVSGAEIVRQAGCELVGASGTGAVDPRVVATFRAAELAVRLETLAGRLEVDGYSATGRMDDAIRTIRPGLTVPSVGDLPIPDSARIQARDLVTLWLGAEPDAQLVAVAALLDSTALAELEQAVHTALTGGFSARLQALPLDVALRPMHEIEAFRTRAIAQGTQNVPAVTVGMTASATTIVRGGNVTVNWTSSGTDVCSAGGGWSGIVNTSGSRTFTALQQSTQYTLTCTGLGGVQQRALSIQVDEPPPTPAPTVSLQAASTTITSGGSAQLSWSSTNATSCSASGGWSGSRPTSGSATVGPLQQNTTFTLSCTGSGGTQQQSVTVQVSAPTPAPTVSLQAASTTITSGGSAQLSWSSTNATSCSASGGWSGSRPTSGSATVGPLQQNTTFTLSCTGSGGTQQQSVTVQVSAPTPAPTVSLQAASTTITSGGSAQLSWSSTNATSCSASGGWSGSRPTSGSATVGPLQQNTTFTLSCTGSGGTQQQSVTVQVSAPTPAPTVSLQAASTTITSGGSAQLSWSSTNATSCSASGGWSGSRPTAGSATVGPLQQATTFSLNCTGAGGSAMSMISVAVNGSVVLRWQAPTQAVDGSPLAGLSGYRIYYGQFSRNYTGSQQISAQGGSEYTLTLPSGEYYIAMTAIGTDGSESAYSNEVVRTVP